MAIKLTQFIPLQKKIREQEEEIRLLKTDIKNLKYMLDDKMGALDDADDRIEKLERNNVALRDKLKWVRDICLRYRSQSYLNAARLIEEIENILDRRE